MLALVAALVLAAPTRIAEVRSAIPDAGEARGTPAAWAADVPGLLRNLPASHTAQYARCPSPVTARIPGLTECVEGGILTLRSGPARTTPPAP